MNREIETFDDLEFSQQCSILRKAGKSWPVSDSDKIILFEDFYKSLPEIRIITRTTEIKIGDTLIYTGRPRGTGMYVPEVGAKWKMETEDDILSASIEIIERRRGWWPLFNSEPNAQECDATKAQ